MAKASVKQRAYVAKLAQDLDDSEFSEVMDATSRMVSVSFTKGRKPRQQTKKQVISSLDSKTASEAIHLLKTPEFVASIKLLSASTAKKK